MSSSGATTRRQRPMPQSKAMLEPHKAGDSSQIYSHDRKDTTPYNISTMEMKSLCQSITCLQVLLIEIEFVKEDEIIPER